MKMSALDAVELIHQAGGLAVMAHPGLNRTDEVIRIGGSRFGRHRMFPHQTSPAMSARYLRRG
jgi:hypothetical protein